MRDRTRLGRAAAERRVGAVLCLLACALTGCLQPRPECSGEVASLDVGEPRRLHVRVLLTRDDRAQRHEVVVSAEPGRIVAVGLTPLGTQAYRIVHDRGGIEIDNRIGRHLGLSPRLAYDAIAHAYLVPGQRFAPASVSAERPLCGYAARVVLVSDEALRSPGPAALPQP
jgi:hypothetical protein